MGENSAIEWTHHTGNLWWGCTEVHAGCDNCYARVFSNRYNEPLWGNDKPRKPIESVFKNLAKWQKAAAKAGEKHRVFVGSMMDIFEKPMPLIGGGTTEDLRQRFWPAVESSPNLIFLLLTKRPGNINKYIPERWKTNPPENVMFGTSPVDQATYDRLVPQLLEVNGKRFLSIEPQLGGIFPSYLNKIDWVIQGGESGHHRRPFNLKWAESMMDFCRVMKVPYFFKQIDKVIPIPHHLLIREFP